MWRCLGDAVASLHAHRRRPGLGRGGPVRSRGPIEVFDRTRLPDGRRAYRIRICAAQFIVQPYPPVPRGTVLEPPLLWLQDNMSRDLTIAEIAAEAGTSTRTLLRQSHTQVGSTPLRWLRRARIRRAQHLLETTDHPVERIGTRVGFGSQTAFRDNFKRVIGVSPNAYRRVFR